MKRIHKALVLAAALLLLPATSLFGASVSEDFASPVPVGDAGKTLTYKLKLEGAMPNVNTALNDTITFAGAETAATVAALSANAVCDAAVDAGYGCQGSVSPSIGFCNGGFGPGAPAAGDKTCCAALFGDSVTLFCYRDADISKPRFLITRIPGAPENFKISDSEPGVVKPGALTTTTNSAIVHGPDILPQYCVRVDRGSPAVDGNINFTIDDGSPSSFTVTTDPNWTDTRLHNEIAAGFRAQGLTAVVLPNAAAKCRFQENFQGPTVFLPNVQANNVTRISTQGVSGQIVSTETSVPGPPIPTLSEWGLILLVALLGISAFYMLHRRRQNTIAT